MIAAGHTKDIHGNSGQWIILDIGFSNNAKSCGLLIDGRNPVELRFNEVVDEIKKIIQSTDKPINLMIEAPLSVAFDKSGNPKGRKIEKLGSKTRYWYVGLGCTIMIAAFYLIQAIMEEAHDKDVRLFEGFVSFKDRSKKSNHKLDARLLYEVVKTPQRHASNIISPNDLKTDESDSLQSAFLIAGFDLGIPPVVTRFEW
jgi:hypothetical protein